MRTKRVIPGILTLVALASFLHAAPSAAATRLDGMAPCYRWPAVDYDGDGVFDRIDRCNDTPRGCTVDAHGCPLDGDGDGVCDGLDRCPDTPPGAVADEQGCGPGQRMATRTTPAPVEPPREMQKPAPPPPATPPPPPPPAPAEKTVSASERQLVESGRIRLENIYFETNSAHLLPESEASLREAGEALEKFPDLKIEVQGHTDTRGASAHNRRLSQDRAGSVRSWLLEHFRLRSENVVARGYGEERPETRERNQEELLRNRRVELVVLNPEVLPRGVKVESK